MARIAVIGAGVIGLSTAVNLQMALPSAHVTIIADKFGRETTSDGAAGSFRPQLEHVPGVSRDILTQWLNDSWEYFSALAQSAHAPASGVSTVSGYHIYSSDDVYKTVPPLYADVVLQCRPCTQRELGSFSGPKHKFGWFFTTLLVECRWYQPWLMDKFLKNGGTVINRHLSSLDELYGHYEVVVNCSGLGSRELLGDNQLRPYRGQMIRVTAPWIKHLLYVENNIWIIPGKETVTVGGTRQLGDDNLLIDPADTEAIWKRACVYLPSLKEAKVEWVWVGLRPYRRPVRVEAETITLPGNKRLKVVHNYGHGGHGVTLSWGTAKHATRLACEMIRRHHSKL